MEGASGFAIRTERQRSISFEGLGFGDLGPGFRVSFEAVKLSGLPFLLAQAFVLVFFGCLAT